MGESKEGKIDGSLLPYITAAARSDLMCFSKFVMPSYEYNWHNERTFQVLNDFAQGKKRRVMIFMPPRHGKSQIGSRFLPAFILGQNPQAKIIATSYSDSLASLMNRDVQRIIDDPLYEQLFPTTRLNSKRVKTSDTAWLRNSSMFEIVEKGGYYVSAGVGGPITGKGADFGIIDDPIKNAEEASSKTVREKIWNWYTSTFYTRIENGGILLIMTRWHEDDLAGRLLQRMEEGGDKWEVISFPAIKDTEDENDPRDIGDALWPGKYDKKELQNIKLAVGTRVWESLYQQRPSPLEGGLFKQSWFQEYDDAPDLVVNFQLDTAYTAKTTNDPTAIVAYVQKGADTYITRAQRVWKEFPDLIDFIKMFVTENGYTSASRIYIEPKASGKSIVQQIRRETGLNVIESKSPTGDKLSRANAVSAIVEAGRVYLPRFASGWKQDFLDEVAMFPNGVHDDQVDCLTEILRRASKPRGRGRRVLVKHHP